MNNAKKFFAIILCAISVAMLAACQWSNDLPMPNPFIDCSDMKAAAKISGFEMTAPETANNYALSKIQAVKDEMIQVIYGDEDNNVCLRKIAKKAVDAKNALTTVTGDYNSYAYSGSIEVDGVKVTVKGDSADAVRAAAWKDGKYYYAITVSGSALTKTTVETLVKAMK